MRERIIVDGVPCVRRGHNFVTRATDELLRNIDRSCNAKPQRDALRRKWAQARKLRGKA